jgi:hypothetical protein
MEAERSCIDTVRLLDHQAKLNNAVGGKLTLRNPTSVADGKTTNKKP